MPLSFKQLQNLFIAGSNINIYPSGNTFAISGSGGSSGGTGTIISGTNRGTGIGLFQGLQTTTNPNDTLGFYNLLEGDNVGIVTNDDGEIVINRGRIVVNTLSNQGNGAKIYTGITGSSIIARTIQASSSGITTSLSGVGNTHVRIAPTNTTLDRFYTITAGPTLGISTTILPTSTTGNVGIGIASVATSRLLVASGTTAISQIRLTPFATEPTSPSNGSIWFSTSGNTLKLERGTTPSDFIFLENNISLSGSTASLLVDTAGTITTKYTNSFGLFNVLTSLTISNTTSETSIISPFLSGSTTLLASNNIYNPELIVGRKYRFSATGILGSDLPPVNLNIRIKLGSTIISSSSTITIGAIDAISLEFDIESTFTVRNSGLIVGSGKIIFSAPPSDITGNPVIFGIYSQNATITTTTNQIFDCTAQFDVADPTNFITIYESTLEILN